MMRAEHRETRICCAAGFEAGGRGHGEGTQASDSVKEQGHDASLEPPERTSHVTVSICVV